MTGDGSREALLPCPFCGEQPRESGRPGTEGEGSGHCHFVACYCGGHMARAHQFGRGDTSAKAEAEAHAAWNRRTPRPDGLAVAWPREAKPAIDGDGWVAISAACEHRMDAAQAQVWNACRAACIGAARATAQGEGKDHG